MRKCIVTLLLTILIEMNLLVNVCRIGPSILFLGHNPEFHNNSSEGFEFIEVSGMRFCSTHLAHTIATPPPPASISAITELTQQKLSIQQRVLSLIHFVRLYPILFSLKITK